MAERVFVRFGAVPVGGRSANDETGALEAGVSCYRAEFQTDDRDVLCLVVADEAAAVTALRLSDERPVFLLEGDLLDVVGGDGEPLLANVTATELDGVEVVTYCVEGEN